MTETRMSCACGFELVGADATIEVYNEHVCCVEGERAPRWHESVFSIEGFFIALALGMVVAVIVYMLGGAK